MGIHLPFDLFAKKTPLLMTIIRKKRESWAGDFKIQL